MKLRYIAHFRLNWSFLVFLLSPASVGGGKQGDFNWVENVLRFPRNFNWVENAPRFPKKLVALFFFVQQNITFVLCPFVYDQVTADSDPDADSCKKANTPAEAGNLSNDTYGF